MTKYDVDYSVDDTSWTSLGTYLGPTVSEGNGDKHFKKYNYFPSGPVRARYVKLTVTSGN